MNKNLGPAQIIQILPKYIQALCSDSALCLSGEQTIATPERKELATKSIKLIQENLIFLEQILSQSKLNDELTLDKISEERSA